MRRENGLSEREVGSMRLRNVSYECVWKLYIVCVHVHLRIFEYLDYCILQDVFANASVWGFFYPILYFSIILFHLFIYLFIDMRPCDHINLKTRHEDYLVETKSVS